jgi:eukaryotic-like serine/threonine-protein kinase
MRVMRDLVGECLSDRYRVIKRLAGGGMGEVYRGHDLLLDRPVAVKVLQSNLAADPEHLERFKAEARSAARFSHPCVVAVYDWGSEDDDTYYMVMEYVSGSDLRDLLVRRAEIEHGVVLEIMAEVCDALEAAHSVGLVHRDIKPENILIARDGKVKVADFGIAIVADADRTTSRTILGTLRYLSPEQAQGNEATRHSDIWAAGAVLSELLTGRPPPHGSGAEALHLRARQTPTRPSDYDPTIPPEIDDIVMRACALQPEDRFANAAEMGEAIRAVNVEAWGRKAPFVGAMFEDVTGEVRPVDMEPTAFDPKSKKARARRLERVRSRRRTAVLGAMLAILLAFGAARAIASFTAPDRVDVPSLDGMSRTRAAAMLDDLDLDLAVQRREQSRTVEAGDVISQRPAGGTLLLEGKSVSVVLSSGPPKVTVPDLTGMTRSQLEVRLKASGLKLGETSNEFSLEPKGTVVSQRPEDRRVRWGSTVSVVLSKGPQSLEVPRVVGLKYADAAKDLKRAGFLAVRVDSYSDDVQVGRVASVEPAEGQSVPEGTEINLYVSIGPEFEKLTMPDVRNLPLDDASARLRSRNLRIDVVQSCGGNGTMVVDTDPVAGVTVRENDVVALFVC